MKTLSGIAPNKNSVRCNNQMARVIRGLRNAGIFFLLFSSLSIFAASNEVVKMDRPTQASWYDCAGLTCATWDYPLGSRLRITEIHNRRSVIVTVNDRGPRHSLVRAGRRIDLSRAAFLQLDGLELGVAEVTIQEIK
jgi:hypothetical protein